MPTPIPSPMPSTAAPTAACLTAFPLVVGGTNNNGCELYVAYDVIAGAAAFSGITAEEADTAAARAVFQDAIARVAGVDIDRVTILGIEASVRRRLTDTIVVNFEVRATAEERAAVDANLLRAEADPAVMDTALQAAAADAGEAALFADVKTESFATDAEAPPSRKKKKKPAWSLGRWIRRNKHKLWFVIVQWILVALAGLCFLACTYRVLRGTVEENCARWRKRSKAPKVKPGATPTPARKKPWSSKKATKPKVKTAPVPSARPDRARRPPPPSSSEEELSDKEAPRATRRSARKTPRRSPRKSTRRRRRLDDDDVDDNRFAGRLVDHTTRRRPVDKPPSIFGSARPPAYSSDDDDEDDDDLERARGRSRRRRFGGPVNRVSDYDQSSDDDSEEYDLPGPPPARRLEMSAAKARSPPMRPPIPPPSPAFPSAFVASRPLYRK